MFQYKIVEQVARKAKPMTGMLKKIMIIFSVIFVGMGIMISQAFMLPGFLMVVLYFAFDIFSQKDYEYTLENNQFIIDVILGKRYRKTVHQLNLNDMEVIAPNWHKKVARYKKNEGSVKLRKYDYTSYDDTIPYYTMIIKSDGEKLKILLDLNEEMLQMLKRLYPNNVFVQNPQKCDENA